MWKVGFCWDPGETGQVGKKRWLVQDLAKDGALQGHLQDVSHKQEKSQLEKVDGGIFTAHGEMGQRQLCDSEATPKGAQYLF